MAEGMIDTHPLLDRVTAISVGIVDGVSLLDLNYHDDVAASVDLNVVMTGRGLLVEVQGTAEGLPFSREELDGLLDLAAIGIDQIGALQDELVAG